MSVAIWTRADEAVTWPLATGIIEPHNTMLLRSIRSHTPLSMHYSCVVALAAAG